MKLLLKLVLVVAILVIVAVVAVIWSIDRIAKAGVERGATFALGVPVTLDRARVGLMSGTFDLENLTVGNPEGFGTPHFLSLGDGGVAVSLGSLRQDLVTLPHLRLEHISINLEKSGGKANYSVITGNLKRFEDDGAKPPADDKDATRFIVNELTIRDVNIHVDLIPVGGDLTKANLHIDEIVLRDIGSDNARGVVLAELASIVVKAILKVAAEKGGGIIPSDILGDLSSQLAQLGDLGEIGSRLQEGVRGAVDDAQKAIEDATKGVTEGLERGLDDARRGLEGVGDRLRPR